MHLIAHHAGEQALAPLLLLAGGGLSLVVAIGRAQVAAARARLTGKQGSTAEAPAAARPASDEPVTVLDSRRVKPGGRPGVARRSASSWLK